MRYSKVITSARGVVLRKLLVGLKGFTGLFTYTNSDYLLGFWKFCSELRFSTFRFCGKKTNIYLLQRRNVKYTHCNVGYW